MSDIQELLSSVSVHSDYEEIDHETYMDAWDGDYPLYELSTESEPVGYRVEVHPVDEDVFVLLISGGPSSGECPVHYRITPSEDIEESLRVFENAGFEHFVSDPSKPDEDPFQQVLNTIEQSAQETASAREEASDTSASPEIFDGCYQCRECGSVRQIGTFAEAAKPPATVGTDCEHCGGERQLDAIEPAAESVMHLWSVVFENVQQDPYRIDLTAPSRDEARTQASTDYPDRTIEVVCHEERV
jgi:hypothetical protein